MGLPDEPPHIKGRTEFDRTASGASPALDTDVELVILDKTLGVDFQK